MEWVRFLVLGVVACGLCLVLRQSKPEYALLLALGAGCVLLFGLISAAEPLFAFAKELAQKAGLPAQTPGILLRALGISLLCQSACDLCVDCGETAMASHLQLAGKIGVLVVGLPLFGGVLSLAGQLLQ